MAYIRDYFLSELAQSSENKRAILNNIVLLFLQASRGKELESRPLCKRSFELLAG